MAEILHHAFNVGVVDVDALHRIDLAKLRLAAEQQTNVLPLATGKGFFRPGTEFLAEGNAGLKARIIEFIAGSSEGYVLELSENTLRVLDGESDEMITRPAVTAAVLTGDFSADTDWTKASSSGQTTTISGGKLNLTARARGGEASAKQTLTINETSTLHALRIVVDRGPVTFRLGSAADKDDLITETTLQTGTHSLAFMPSGASAYITFSLKGPHPLVVVDSCTVEAAGVMSLPTPWDGDAVWLVEFEQSLDVMFNACAGVQQQRIERRGTGLAAGQSWSVVDYEANDGPFGAGPNSTLTLTPSALEGTVTLTASKPYFKSGMVGQLFKIWHENQNIDTYLVGVNQFTPTFMVTGITETNFEERKYTYTISGTWVGTIRNRRSFDGEDIEFHDVRRAQTVATIDITANATYTNDDNDDNAIAWYKLGFTSYTSGEARVVLSYEGGGGYGIARVTAVDAGGLTATADVLTPFKNTTASEDWQPGMWSDYSGWPAGVALVDGRLCWGGDDSFWGSVSDAYDSFDEEVEGDSGPLIRSIALAGRNEVRWLMTLDQVMVGCDSRIASVRASTLDEILTPTNFNVKNVDSVPAAPITPVELRNGRALFVADSRTNVYEVNYSNEAGGFLATKFSLLTDNLFASGVTQMAATSFPDQRVFITTTEDDNHAGDMIMYLYEPLLEISAAVPIATAEGDVIESVCVLPGTPQDRVYLSVRREVDGSTVRYLEKLALDREAKPATVSKCMDSHVSGTGAHSATITGLDHLEGREVVAWVDGDAVNDAGTTTTSTFTVSGGEITLPSAPTAGWCVGLAYRGRYKCARLAYGSDGGSPFLKNKKVGRIGMLLADYCRSGIQFGGWFDNASHPLRSLPRKGGNGAVADEVVSGVGIDEETHPIDGAAEFDPRICIEMNSPKPATILALVLDVS